MKAWNCEACGADIKETKKPEFCPLCKRRGPFSEIEMPEPSHEDLLHSKKYEDAVKMIEEREEGCPPRSLHDAICGCGGHEVKKKGEKHG
jgi:hypothetical protein